MSKTKTPFLSLGSHGTVASAITSQKRDGFTVIRNKPIPANPNSWPQIWQRKKYLFCCQCWNGLSLADKRTWASVGSRYHLPALAAFIRSFITIFQDCVAYWPLDYVINSDTYDYSGNLNHATVFGASPSDGIFDRALYFDGLNDYLSLGNVPAFHPTDVITLIAWFNTSNAALQQGVFYTQTPATFDGYRVVLDTGKLKGRFGKGAAPWAEVIGTTPLVASTNYCAALRFDGSITKLFLNGLSEGTFADARPLNPSNKSVYSGTGPVAAAFWFKGILDELLIFHAPISDANILIISNRKETQ
jgi:hypothetical protein